MAYTSLESSFASASLIFILMFMPGAREVRCIDVDYPFPVYEYYFDAPKDSVDPTYLMRLEQRTLCNPPAIFSSYDDFRCCSCNTDCTKYKTCCIDFKWTDYISSTNNTSLDGYKDYLVRESLSYKEVVCSNITSYPVQKQNMLVMVSTCPEHAPDQDNLLCAGEPSDEAIVAPVLGVDGYIYRNTNCARCHSTYSFVALSIALECDDFNPPLEGRPLFEGLRGCTASLEKGEATQPSCSGYDRPRQSASELSIASDLCKAYDGFVYDPNGVVHKNFDCLKEFSGETTGLSSSHQQFHFKSCATMGFKPRFSVTVSLEQRIEVNVRDARSDKTVYSTVATCSSGDRYDVFTGRCVPLSCGSGYVNSGSQCIFSELDTHALSTIEKLKQCIAAQNGGLYVLKRAKNESSTDLFLSALNQSLIRYKPFQNGPESASSRNSEIVLLGLIDNASTINATILLAQHNASIYEHVSDIYISNNNRLLSSSHLPDHQFILQTIFPDSRLCAKPRMLDLREVNISSTCSLATAHSTYKSTEYVSWFHSNKTLAQEVVFHVCDGFYQHTCKGEWKLVTNYTRRPNLTVTTSDRSDLQFTDYAPVQDGIKVCRLRKNLKTNSWQTLVEDVEAYVTLIGIILSMGAYVWLIVTYLYFHELRTNPGKYVASLCLSLLISDMLFLSQLAVEDSSRGCKMVAVLLHYFVLCTHSWAAVITLDLTHTFLAQEMGKNHRSRKWFCLFSAAGWLSPLFLVVLGISLDECGAVEMGYGKFSGACWIQSFEGRLTLYVVPSQIVDLGCFILLSVTLYRIRKQRMENSSILNSRSDQRQLARIAFRLVIVLGIVEVIGFAQGSSSSSEPVLKALSLFQVLYSLLRGFRGVFIWIFYILLNRTIWLLYKGAYTKWEHKTARATLSASSSVLTESTL